MSASWVCFDYKRGNPRTAVWECVKFKDKTWEMPHLRSEMCMHMIYELLKPANILANVLYCCQNVNQPLQPAPCSAMLLDKNGQAGR